MLWNYTFLPPEKQLFKNDDDLPSAVPMTRLVAITGIIVTMPAFAEFTMIKLTIISS